MNTCEKCRIRRSDSTCEYQNLGGMHNLIFPINITEAPEAANDQRYEGWCGRNRVAHASVQSDNHTSTTTIDVN